MVEIKAVLLGDSGVGKTAIAHRAATGSYVPGSFPTVGAAHLDVRVTMPDRRTTHFSVWDTAGQEQYRTVVPMYFRSAVAAILVFDVTQRDTFEHVREWAELLDRHVSSCHIALVGNKIDLPGRVIIEDEADAVRGEIHAGCYIETSAVTGENIEGLFISLAQAIETNTIATITVAPTVAIPELRDTGERAAACC
jgi:small GTP-binding protein